LPPAMQRALILRHLQRIQQRRVLAQAPVAEAR
jgi:hypothetical protein